jgi:hypothetical protein
MRYRRRCIPRRNLKKDCDMFRGALWPHFTMDARICHWQRQQMRRCGPPPLPPPPFALFALLQRFQLLQRFPRLFPCARLAVVPASSLPQRQSSPADWPGVFSPRLARCNHELFAGDFLRHPKSRAPVLRPGLTIFIFAAQQCSPAPSGAPFCGPWCQPGITGTKHVQPRRGDIIRRRPTPRLLTIQQL